MQNYLVIAKHYIKTIYFAVITLIQVTIVILISEIVEFIVIRSIQSNKCNLWGIPSNYLYL